MLSLLKDLISRNPFVEELEFQDRGLDRLDAHSVEILSRFSELKKISLQDNDIRRLPADLSQLAQIREINLSGNPIENLQKAVESLATMPQLDSLQINLHLEEEVDFLLRSLPRLQILNGLAVERDAIFSDEDEEQEIENYLLRLENGLFALQSIVYIIMDISVNGSSAVRK
jgi:Leucine-rich repeat (LRR) protein